MRAGGTAPLRYFVWPRGSAEKGVVGADEISLIVRFDVARTHSIERSQWASSRDIARECAQMGST